MYIPICHASHDFFFHANFYLRQNALGCWVPGLENQEWWVKELFVPGGTLPTHPVCSPSLWTCDMRGLLMAYTYTYRVYYCISYARNKIILPDKEGEAILSIDSQTTFR